MNNFPQLWKYFRAHFLLIQKSCLWAGEVAQVEQGLPSKHEALSSNSSTAKTIKKQKQKQKSCLAR
jgi:hypothetical protein